MARGASGLDPSAVLEDVVSAFHDALRRENSELTARPEVRDELTVQVRSVLEEVIAAVGAHGTPPAESTGASRAFSLDVGVQRARDGVHPVQSLRAASSLFDVMLPILVRELAPPDGPAVMRISRALHQAIMTRVALASLSYVSFLLDKLQASRKDERLRIARELHDRVLHGMTLTLQGIDMHRFYAGSDPALAGAKLDRAVASLDEAVRTVQQLSAELRRSVGENGLEKSLRAYLEAHAEPSVHVTLRAGGDLAQLPPDLTEELYLVIREACRNALRHASPSRLDIDITADGRNVRAVVTDDGCGFSTGTPTDGAGLHSMRERALLLHGQLSVSSTPGTGTRVEVHIPLPESHP